MGATQDGRDPPKNARYLLCPVLRPGLVVCCRFAAVGKSFTGTRVPVLTTLGINVPSLINTSILDQ